MFKFKTVFILIVSLTLILFANCASQRAQINPSEAARDPASFVESEVFRKYIKPFQKDDLQRLEATFQMLFKENKSIEELISYTSRIRSLYLRAQVLVDQFDRELDQALLDPNQEKPFLESKTYSKLRVMYLLSRQELIKFSYLYQRLIEVETRESEVNHLERELAKKHREAIDDYLFRQSGIERIALQDVLEQVNEIRELFHLEKYRILAPSELSNEFKRFKNKLVKKALQEWEKIDELKSEIEEIAESNIVQYVPNSLFEQDRSPQSVRYAPGTGKTGNLNGSEFPVGTWVLTYDDGPSPKHTKAIIDALEKYQVKATFFWLQGNVKLKENAKIVAEVKKQKHLLANHTISHPILPKLSLERQKREIAYAQEQLTQLYGEAPKFFRCPYGAGLNNKQIREIIASQNLMHVFWNVDTLDWQDKNPESVIARAEKQMALNKRGIVLFHDVHPQSVIASTKLVAKTYKKIQWKSLSEVMDLLNGIQPNSP